MADNYYIMREVNEELSLFEREAKMRMSKNIKYDFRFGKKVNTSVYVASWDNTVNVEINDDDDDGVLHTFDIYLPIDAAEKLAKEIIEDIAAYRVKEAKVAEEAEEAEEAEA